MKNRRLALVAFLLCACMIVGVGYAALAVQLTIDGTVAFHETEDTELNQKVHFTGNVTIFDATGAVVDKTETQVVIADATSGATTAHLDVNFVGKENDDPFYIAGEVMHKVTVRYEFEMIADETEDLVVDIGRLSLNGAVGTVADFQVVSTAYEDPTDTVISETQVTVPQNTTLTCYIDVVVTLNSANVTDDIDATAFQIVLPVTKVEETA